MADGDNPTRRYRWLRPRQANWAAVATANAVNFATLYLFNNSNGAHVLVGRRYEGGDTAGPNSLLGMIHGKTGTLQSAGITPMVAGEAVQPGVFYFDDRAARYTPNMMPSVAGMILNTELYPYFVLQPGFSFFMQSNTTGNGLIASILWEAVFPDQLDFMGD